MARYTGPRLRKVRALGAPLPGLTAKSDERRPYPPGQHGNRRAPKPSDYKRQLVERQKLRFNYGVSEASLRRTVVEARRRGGRADENLLALLEWRLDNLVFRAGFTRTIPAARQLVVHGHVLVDGKRLDRPSARVAVGSVITVTEGARKRADVQSGFEAPRFDRPEWLTVDREGFAVTLASQPTHDSVLLGIETSLVIEHYATRV